MDFNPETYREDQERMFRPILTIQTALYPEELGKGSYSHNSEEFHRPIPSLEEPHFSFSSCKRFEALYPEELGKGSYSHNSEEYHRPIPSLEEPHFSFSSCKRFEEDHARMARNHLRLFFSSDVLQASFEEVHARMARNHLRLFFSSDVLQASFEEDHARMARNHLRLFFSSDVLQASFEVKVKNSNTLKQVGILYRRSIQKAICDRHVSDEVLQKAADRARLEVFLFVKENKDLDLWEECEKLMTQEKKDIFLKIKLILAMNIPENKEKVFDVLERTMTKSFKVQQRQKREFIGNYLEKPFLQDSITFDEYNKFTEVLEKVNKISQQVSEENWRQATFHPSHELPIILSETEMNENYKSIRSSVFGKITFLILKINKNEPGFEQLLNAVAVGEELTHPNIARVFGYTTWPDKMGVLMEHMPCGSLYDLLNDENDVAIPTVLKLQFLLDIVAGLMYLFNRNCRLMVDFKRGRSLHNIRLSLDLQCKLVCIAGEDVMYLKQSNESELVHSFGHMMKMMLDNGRQDDDDLLAPLHDLMMECLQSDASQKPTLMEVCDTLSPLLSTNSHQVTFEMTNNIAKQILQKSKLCRF
ncbi:uncharacterized protein LOC143461077 isoform X2 [Clavelina lepadiformis]|uniref:uncharacterized protein LOC143461077 isoform X2 n=1 Tax=Clavelina lepadiformis TaxID=159417 RepID=UPI004041DAFA